VARARPKASDVARPDLTCLEGERPDRDPEPLTRAQKATLRRTAAATHNRLKEHFAGLTKHRV
jgi:hypothetical protein